MLQKQVTFYTPEEYLALEEKADHKSEYYNGEIFAVLAVRTIITSSLAILMLLSTNLPRVATTQLPTPLSLWKCFQNPPEITIGVSSLNYIGRLRLCKIMCSLIRLAFTLNIFIGGRMVGGF
jgi:hypothetical protein